MQFNWSTFVFQIINFLILVFILYKVLYKPITTVIKKRRRAIEEKFKEAKAEQDKAEKLKKDYELKLLEINREQNTILAQARTEAEEERKHLIEEARKDAGRERTKAMRSLDQEIEKRLGDLQKTIASSATRLANTMLQQVSGKELNEYLAQHMLEKIRGINTEGFDLPQSSTAIDVTLFAAQEPGQSTVERFKAELHKVFGATPTIMVRQEPSMVAGFRVEIGELILDAGFNRQLEDWKKSLQKSLREYA